MWYRYSKFRVKQFQSKDSASLWPISLDTPLRILKKMKKNLVAITSVQRSDKNSVGHIGKVYYVTRIFYLDHGLV